MDSIETYKNEKLRFLDQLQQGMDESERQMLLNLVQRLVHNVQEL